MIRAAMALLIPCMVGCATTPVPMVVHVPVVAPCIESMPFRPQFPADALTDNDDIFVIGQTLMADIETRKGYELTLEIALSACLKAP